MAHTMYLFENTGGTHTQGGKVYKNGARIVTDVDLRVIFGEHHFKLLNTDGAAPVPPPAVVPESDTGVVMPNLLPPVTPAAPQGDEAGDDEALKAPVDPNAKFGEDVTDIFEEQAGDIFKVFKHKKDYTVVRADTPGTAVNGKPLTNRPDVTAFITAKLAE